MDRSRSHDELIRQAERHGRTSFNYRRWAIRLYPLTTKTKDGRQPQAEAKPHDPSLLPEERRDQWLATPDSFDPARPGPRQLTYGLRGILATVDRYADNPQLLQAG